MVRSLSPPQSEPVMSDIFITENFLLQNGQAIELYHRFAEKMPIIDYHCHLPPGKSPKTAVSTTSPKSGWPAITKMAGHANRRRP